MTEMTNEHQRLITQAVKNAFETDSWLHVDTFSRGHSPSVLYKLEIENNHYVAKLADPHYSGWNLSTAYGAQINAFKNGVAPKIHYSNPNTGILITEYIEAVSSDKINRKQPDRLEKLAKLLKRLHRCDDFQQGPSIYDRIEFMHNPLPLDFKSHPLIKQAMQVKETIQQTLVDAKDIKPCHGDVTPFNLLFDGNDFCLVDWDTVTQDNFYFDLATAMIFFYFDDEHASEVFLEHYFGQAPNQMETDKLNVMTIFVYLYYGISLAFTSSGRKIDLLSQEAIEALPNYSQFMDSIASGKVNLSDGQSQQQLGFIYLKMADAVCRGDAFKNSISRLKHRMN